MIGVRLGPSGEPSTSVQDLLIVEERLQEQEAEVSGCLEGEPLNEAGRREVPNRIGI